MKHRRPASTAPGAPLLCTRQQPTSSPTSPHYPSTITLYALLPRCGRAGLWLMMMLSVGWSWFVAGRERRGSREQNKLLLLGAVNME
jgi:hypothetical protein